MAEITLELYRCPSDERMVSKTLNDKFTFNHITFKNDTSIMNPVFIVGAIKDNTEPMDTVGWWRKFNYCYCPNLERYYYITSKEYDSKGFCTLSCHVDVLKTYANHILGSTQLVNRGEMTKTRNRYIVDNQMPIHSDNAYTIKQASPTIITPNVPSNGNLTSSLIMATVGRGTL